MLLLERREGVGAGCGSYYARVCTHTVAATVHTQLTHVVHTLQTPARVVAGCERKHKVANALRLSAARAAGLRACLRAAQLRASGAAAEPVEPESEEEAAGAHVRLGARRKARRGEQ